MTQRQFRIFAWTMLAFAILVPIIVWGKGIDWEIGNITIYQWFPLFGMLAWMIMWTHYITGSIRIKKPTLFKPKYYSGVTGYLVLGCLLLHPGLLAYAQYKNGVGLPPGSFYDYVGSGLILAVVFGSIALLIFLSFEIFDRLKERKSIKKWWPIISISQSLAMLLIFVHGIRLGSSFSNNWFTLIWWGCGLALIPCFYIIHRNDIEEYVKL